MNDQNCAYSDADTIRREQRGVVFKAGYHARREQNKDISANPYINVGREDLRDEWRAGWYAAGRAS